MSPNQLHDADGACLECASAASVLAKVVITLVGDVRAAWLIAVLEAGGYRAASGDRVGQVAAAWFLEDALNDVRSDS